MSLKALRPQLVAAAQGVYDEWDGDDEDLGGGGICDLIADEMASVLANEGFEAASVLASVGENHIFVVAQTDDGVFSVDIPPGVYETGSGYSWTKIEGVVFEPRDIVIARLSSDPDDFDEYANE